MAIFTANYRTEIFDFGFFSAYWTDIWQHFWRELILYKILWKYPKVSHFVASA